MGIALATRAEMRPTNNRLLDQLPPGELDRLRPHLTAEVLPLNQTLQERGKPVRSVLFPTSGMISIVAMMRDGASVEVGIAGREGMLGVQVVLGDDISIPALKGVVEEAHRQHLKVAVHAIDAGSI